MKVLGIPIRVTFFRVFLLVVLAAVGIVIWMVKDGVVGGQYLQSPDGKFRADITGPLQDSGRPWRHISVYDTAAESKVFDIRLDLTPGSDVEPPRGGERLIQWSADSSYVTITVEPQASLTLRMPK